MFKCHPKVNTRLKNDNQPLIWGEAVSWGGPFNSPPTTWRICLIIGFSCGPTDYNSWRGWQNKQSLQSKSQDCHFLVLASGPHAHAGWSRTPELQNIWMGGHCICHKIVSFKFLLTKRKVEWLEKKIIWFTFWFSVGNCEPHLFSHYSNWDLKINNYYFFPLCSQPTRHPHWMLNMWVLCSNPQSIYQVHVWGERVPLEDAFVIQRSLKNIL